MNLLKDKGIADCGSFTYGPIVYAIAEKVLGCQRCVGANDVWYIPASLEADSSQPRREVWFFLSNVSNELAVAKMAPIPHFYLTGRFVTSILSLIVRLWADKSVCPTIDSESNPLMFPRLQVSEVPFGIEQLWATWHSDVVAHAANSELFDCTAPNWLPEAWTTMGDRRRRLAQISFYAATEFTIGHEYTHHMLNHFECAKSRHDIELEADSMALRRVLLNRADRSRADSGREVDLEVCEAKLVGIVSAFLVFHLEHVLRAPATHRERHGDRYPTIGKRIDNVLDILFESVCMSKLPLVVFFKCLHDLIRIGGVHPAFNYAIGAPWGGRKND